MASNTINVGSIPTALAMINDLKEWFQSEEGKKALAKIAEAAKKEREKLYERLQVPDEVMRKKITI